MKPSINYNNSHKSILRELGEMILEAVYPSRAVCIFCDNEALLNAQKVCDKCAQKLIVVESCQSILSNNKCIDDMRASFRYAGNVANAIKRLKYHNCRYLAEGFAAFMEPDMQWDIDYVVPVPLHKSRERARGFNQCRLIAEYICERYSLEMNDRALSRVVNTKKQARLKGNERETNLTGAFLASEECRGKTILLIDDVCTTGTTLRECAIELKKKGATKVYALVFSLSRDESPS